MATALELSMEYNAIPLSRRIARELEGNPSKIKSYDNWGADMDAVVDPDTGFTALMAAAKNGNFNSIEILVNRGAEVNFRTELKGRSALHTAAKYGHTDCVILLLRLGALINLGDKFGMTALMQGAKVGSLAVVKVLLEKGAGINIQDRGGWVPIHFAAKYGHKPVLECLINAGAAMNVQDNKEGKTALMYAAQYGRRESLRLLLSRGVDVDALSKQDGVTALMLACREGHKGIVSDLLEAGADPHIPSHNGWTALLFAAAAGRRDTSHILVSKAHVDINFYDESSGGFTALTVASRAGREGVVKLLLDLGANIDWKDTISGMTPLMHAAKNGSTFAADCLISYQADVNGRDFNGMTPLMHAAANGHSSSIVNLINSDSDVNAEDRKHKTAFDYAIESGHRNVFVAALLLISPQAKIKFVPWLERECPKMLRGSDLSNASVYLNHFLYGHQGLYTGLYLRSRDHDNELICNLVMLSAAFNRSCMVDWQLVDDMKAKLAEVDRMLQRCLDVRAMCADETVANCLLLHQPAVYRTQFDLINMQPALASGPLALYMENNLTKMLTYPAIYDKMRLLFTTCSRKPDVLQVEGSFLGALRMSPWIRCRYIPAVMFVMEELPKALTVLLICLAGYMPHLVQPTQLIVLVYFLIAVHELGQVEEKRWAESPSLLVDKIELRKRRWHNIWRHFWSNTWKRLDGLSMLLILLWVLAWLFVNRQAAFPILGLAAIPMSLGVLRIPSAFFPEVGISTLLVFNMLSVALRYFFILVFAGLGFGVAMYIIFSADVPEYATPGMCFITLFETIFRSNQLSVLEGAPNASLGVFLLMSFMLFSTMGVITVLMAHITANFKEQYQTAKESYVLWFCQVVQNHSMVYERSPLCMLPIPFNIISTVLYLPHHSILMASRQVASNLRHFSLAGWISDIIMALIFLPVAYSVHFFTMLPLSPYTLFQKTLMVVFCPILIAVNTAALVLTCGWIPERTFVLFRATPKSSRYKICYVDRRDCIVKVGYPEIPLPHYVVVPDEPSVSLDSGGYIGFVDPNERDFYYYGLKLLAIAMMSVRRIEDAYRACTKRLFQRSKISHLLDENAAAGGADTDNSGAVFEDHWDSDGDDELGVEHDDLQEHVDDAVFDDQFDNDAFLRSRGQSAPAVFDEHGFEIKNSSHVHKERNYHWDIPVHSQALFSKVERDRIFEVVIPEVVHEFPIHVSHRSSPAKKQSTAAHPSSHSNANQSENSVVTTSNHNHNHKGVVFA